jgi:GNAT superfamily N-acetyltransferase
MPIASRHARDPLPTLPPMSGLTVRRTTDRSLMAALQGRHVDVIADRFASGHRAYVAWCDGEPAAFGWAAMTGATIGELGITFDVPLDDAYLWNFVTLPAFRGRGIYPRLLDAIVRAESGEVERFWIVRAPENHASGAGIAKAGFTELAELSFDENGRAAVHALIVGGGTAAARLLGVAEASGDLSLCWRCVREGKLEMACASGVCSCDYQRKDGGCA